MVIKMTEMKGVLKSDHGWTLLLNSPKDMILIETKTSVRDLTMMRATGDIPFPPT